MLRSKCASASKIAIVIVLIFAATIATSQGSGTSPGIDLINFNNLSLMEYKEPIMYDIGNGSHCNISTGFESNRPWEITRSLNGTEGKDGKALHLVYGLGECNNSYVQVVFIFNPPQDFSAYDHLVIDWRGDQKANSLDVGINDTKNQSIVPYPHATQKSWWGPLVIPFKLFGSDLDLKKVEKIFISVKNDSNNSDYRDEAGFGNITIDSLRLLNISTRKTTSDFESVNPDLNASRAASKWLASQQQFTGLLKSWEEEDKHLAHLYDQALALIVFSQENMSYNATQLVGALVDKQNKDGSWYKTYDFSNKNNVTADKWIGDVAWVVYALNRYIELGGDHPGAKKAIDNGTKWLEEEINLSPGCLENKPVEGAMDTWWALRASGKIRESNNLRDCIIASYWDEDMGRFKAGKDDWKPVSDVQTWGAAMLKATGEKEKALREPLAMPERLCSSLPKIKMSLHWVTRLARGRSLMNVLASISLPVAMGAIISCRN